MKIATPSFSALGCSVCFAALAGCSGSINGAPPMPHPTGVAPVSSIQHIVIMVQENRSFENMFAGFPGANAPMEGPCKPKLPLTTWCKTAREVALKPVSLENCQCIPGTDVSHDHTSFLIECDRNALHVCQNDGFDLVTHGETYMSGTWAKLYPYRYVERSESKPYWNLASRYTLADNMFSTDTASSFIAHQELIAGTVRLDDEKSLTDQPNGMPWGCDAVDGTQSAIIFKDGRYYEPPRASSDGPPYLPFPCFDQYKTMADLFDAANTTWTYYVWPLYGVEEGSGLVWNGFDAIEKIACTNYRPNTSGLICKRGPDWKHLSFPNTKIFSDLKKGKLAQVSWVIPTICDSDHPSSGANRGPLWVTEVLNAIGTSRFWKNTAVVLLWDDWGGWYDNVPPPQISYTSLGFRVPMIVISPYAKPHYISHTQYDIGSILKFIEQNFGLGNLGASDVTANSIGDVFDYTQKPNRFTPAPLPHVSPCPTGTFKELVEKEGGPPG
jgi:phospholipase C